MSESPGPGRAVMWFAVGIGYAVAAGAFILRLTGSELSVPGELPGALTLGVVAAVPPTLAVVGLTSRPQFLIPAAVTAILGSAVLSVLGIPLLVAGVIWAIGVRLPRGTRAGTTVAVTIVVVMLWVGAAAVLFLHLDPRCAQTMTDGSTRMVDARVRGFESGWVWGTESTGSSSSSGADVVLETCQSDTVTGWELLMSFALLTGAVTVGWSLTREPAPAPAHSAIE